MAKLSKSKRSLAAKKGWETRRANARSEAAKKGWETRRANARSEAAKRGWKTRRRNKARAKDKRAKARQKARRKRLQRHEYQINVKYVPKEGAKVEVQIAAFGPSDQTRKQVIEAVDYYLDEGENMEDNEGNVVWEVHIRFWERYGRQSFGDDESARMHLKFFVGDADLEVTNKTTGKTL